jgi:hypothetical protein
MTRERAKEHEDTNERLVDRSQGHRWTKLKVRHHKHLEDLQTEDMDVTS